MIIPSPPVIITESRAGSLTSMLGSPRYLTAAVGCGVKVGLGVTNTFGKPLP
jgi:hypothetical protein